MIYTLLILNYFLFGLIFIQRYTFLFNTPFFLILESFSFMIFYLTKKPEMPLIHLLIMKKLRVYDEKAHAWKLGVSKKIRKSIKSRKPEKKNKKNRTEKKNRLNFWKNRPVRFRFYKQKTKKTKPNRTETDKKPSQTGPKLSQTRKTEPKPRKPSQNRKNRAKPVWTGFCPKKPNWTETGRFDPVSVFFFKKKNFSLVTFFDKNWIKPKIITPKKY